MAIVEQDCKYGYHCMTCYHEVEDGYLDDVEVDEYTNRLVEIDISTGYCFNCRHEVEVEYGEIDR